METFKDHLKAWWDSVDTHWYDLQSIIHVYAKDMLQDATKAKSDRDHLGLYRVMNEAWFNAPDHKGIHSIPGWGVLCDLLSELPREDMPYVVGITDKSEERK